MPDQAEGAGPPIAAPAVPPRRTDLLSVRAAIARLVLAAVAPVVLLAAGLIALVIEEERSNAKRSLAHLAGTLTAAIDAEVGRTLLALKVLALDEAFDRRDFNELRRRATAVQLQHGRLSNLVLIGLDGTRHLNLRVPAGAPIPLPKPLMDPEIAAAREGRQYISNAVVSPTSGKSLVYFSVPVMRQGGAQFVLTATMEFDAWTDWLAGQVPQGTIAALDDASGVIFARSAAPERFVGRPAVDVVLQRYQAGEVSGSLSFVNREGQHLYGAFTTSTLTGWHTLVLAPAALLDSPGQRAIVGLLVSSFIALLVALLVATRAAEPLRDGMTALREAVRALGRGEPVAVPSFKVRELQQTADAAADAARLLHERQQAALSARDALEESERRFRALADQSPILIWVTDARGEVAFVNRMYAEFFGRSEEQLRAGGWQALIHPDDGAYGSTFLQALTARTPWRGRARARAADGAWRWIESRSVPRYSETGQYLGQAGSSLDITDQVLAEEALRASEERLQLAIAAGNAGAWDWDLRCDRNVWTDSHFTLLGFTPTPDRVAPRDLWTQSILAADLDAVYARLQTARQQRSMFRSEHRARRASDGAILWLRATGRFLYDENGEAVRFVGVFFDATEEKRAQLALQEADRRKDEFLATLAHELRNPLAPIRNAVEVLKHPGAPLEAPAARSLQIIDRQVTQLARLVDDLMDVSRVTLGRIPLQSAALPMADVLHEAADAARPLVEECRQRLSLHLPDRPVWVHGDRTRLIQVLLNLLNNAAKYSRPGGAITLSLETRNGEAVVTVADTGVGIPPEMLDRVFDLFTQVDAAEHRSRGGLGIGLSLVRRLVELHGGTVSAESAGVDQGSRFVVRLPLTAPVAKEAEAKVTGVPTAADPALAARRVLIVDDNADAADTLATMLQMLGLQVRVAYDGYSALALATDFAPEVALLDIGLPGMNGYDLARALREQAGDTAPMLIALSGWGQQEDRRRSAAAGIQHHLVKPVSIEALVELLKRPSPGAVTTRSG